MCTCVFFALAFMCAGKTAEGVDFAATFQAVLLGIKRQGTRLSAPLNLTPLEVRGRRLFSLLAGFDHMVNRSCSFTAWSGRGRRSRQRCGWPKLEEVKIVGTLCLALLAIAGRRRADAGGGAHVPEGRGAGEPLL